jgi:CheY-like chemotaxis protein
MDLHMPIMDGFEATQKIKDSGCNTPIYALSADVIDETRAKVKELGFSGMLLKPFRPSELLEILQKI